MQVEKKKQTLDAATEAFQFFSDCNETESVIKEFITLAKSKVNTVCNILLHVITVLSPRLAQDFGQDKLTAVSLLGRHKHLQDKVQSIEPDVVRGGPGERGLVETWSRDLNTPLSLARWGTSSPTATCPARRSTSPPTPAGWRRRRSWFL